MKFKIISNKEIEKLAEELKIKKITILQLLLFKSKLVYDDHFNIYLKCDRITKIKNNIKKHYENIKISKIVNQLIEDV